jgi:hypothetical protein
MTKRPAEDDFLSGITESQTAEQRAVMRENYKRVIADIATGYASGEIRSVIIVTADTHGTVRGGYHIEKDDKHPMLTRLRTILQRTIRTWNAEGSLPKLPEIRGA